VPYQREMVVVYQKKCCKDADKREIGMVKLFQDLFTHAREYPDANVEDMDAKIEEYRALAEAKESSEFFITGATDNKSSAYSLVYSKMRELEKALRLGKDSLKELFYIWWREWS